MNRFNELKQHAFFNELLLVLGFGVLSILIGQIQFFIPGVEGGVSDFREIALLIGVFYFRYWVSIPLVSLITALATPANGSFFSTFSMHALALIVAFSFFQYLDKQKINRFLNGLYWFLFTAVYYALLLIPLMVLTNHFAGIIKEGDLVAKYFHILGLVRFEMVSTAAITSLFLINLKANQILKRQNLVLQIAKDKAEGSERLKTAFLQNISHEIRTPLNGIMGFARLLQNESENTPPISIYTQSIVNCGNQLLSTVQDIIDISQITAQQMIFKVSEKKLELLMHELEKSFEPKTFEKKMVAHFQFDGDPNTEIISDQYKLERSLYHLIDNAIKYGQNKDVTIQAAVDDNRIIFQIIDQGIGISTEHQKVIFKNFQQLETGITRNFGGNGLGLSIVKGFISFIGGEIQLNSKEGEGSRFVVSIPKTVPKNHLS
jgi:signal transduction histidine kinase